MSMKLYILILRKFESGFARIHDSRNGCTSNSGTSPLQVALQAMKELHNWGDGDEVIVPECTHSFMMYPIVIRNSKKTELVNYLESRGIETRDMLPLVNQTLYQEYFGIKEGDYPVADWINNNGFYIACHQGLSQEDLDYIVSVLENCFHIKVK